MKNFPALLFAIACVHNSNAVQGVDPCAAPSIGMRLTVSAADVLPVESARGTQKLRVPRYTSDATAIPVDEVPLKPGSRYSVRHPARRTCSPL